MTLTATLHSSVADIAQEVWDRCLPGEAEGWAYYSACEACSPPRLHPSLVAVRAGAEVVALAPMLYLEYRLDTALQDPRRRFGRILRRIAKDLLVVRVIGLGSLYAERCHLGFDPALGATGRVLAVEQMLAALERYARASNIGTTAVKDLAPNDAQHFSVLAKAHGYAELRSLPVAVLEVPDNESIYLGRLSAATRKDVRRKLRNSAVAIETLTDISSVAAEVERLYEHTREHSALDYGSLEMLPAGYFRVLSELGSEQIVFKLYWLDGKLLAFNLLLVERDRVIDKFIGMRYPEARAHNVYVLSWMENVRFCIARGIGRLQTGQTAYAAKLRLGSSLVPSRILFKHRSAFVQWLLRLASPWLAFDRNDPDLRARAGSVAGECAS
jgi:hypothetical protein